MTDTICFKDEKIGQRQEVALQALPAGRPSRSGMKNLTPRQQEILRLLAKGFYYKEIGAALGISPSTVRTHLHSVYSKLEVKSRALAVIKFHEQTWPQTD